MDNGGRLHVAMSFDAFTDGLLDKLALRTGLTRSEIVRRLLVSYAASKENTSVLPVLSTPITGATSVWKEMIQ